MRLYLVPGAFPQVRLSEKEVYEKMLIEMAEHLEILALRRATPLNPDAVTDVRCWNTEE